MFYVFLWQLLFLSCPSPVQSMCLLNQLSLFPSVFTLPHGIFERVGMRFGDDGVACLEATSQLLNDLSIEVMFLF